MKGLIKVSFLLICILTVFTGCEINKQDTKSKKEISIEFYKSQNKIGGTLSEKSTNLPSDKQAFIKITSAKEFNAESISIDFYIKSNGNNKYAGNANAIIKKQDKEVVIPFQLVEIGEYEAVVYFDNPENPIAKSTFSIEMQ